MSWEQPGRRFPQFRSERLYEQIIRWIKAYENVYGHRPEVMQFSQRSMKELSAAEIEALMWQGIYLATYVDPKIEKEWAKENRAKPSLAALKRTA